MLTVDDAAKDSWPWQYSCMTVISNSPSEIGLNRHHALTMQHCRSWIASACQWLFFCQQKLCPSWVRCTLALSMPCTRHMRFKPLCSPYTHHHCRQVSEASQLQAGTTGDIQTSKPASTGLFGLHECSPLALYHLNAEAVVRGQHACVGTSEEGVVSLYNEEVGMWEYKLSGVGVRPGMMEPTRITATLGSDGSSFVSWRNPFVDPVKVTLVYAFAGPCPCFSLCLGCCI